MRRLLLGALPFAVLAAMLALRAWDPLPRQHLRWLAFDQYQRLAPRDYDPGAPVKPLLPRWVQTLVTFGGESTIGISVLS